MNQHIEPNHKKIGVLIGFFDFADQQKHSNLVNIQIADGEADAVISRVYHRDDISWNVFDLYTWLWSWEGLLNGELNLV